MRTGQDIGQAPRAFDRMDICAIKVFNQSIKKKFEHILMWCFSCPEKSSTPFKIRWRCGASSDMASCAPTSLRTQVRQLWRNHQAITSLIWCHWKFWIWVVTQQRSNDVTCLFYVISSLKSGAVTKHTSLVYVMSFYITNVKCDQSPSLRRHFTLAMHTGGQWRNHQAMTSLAYVTSFQVWKLMWVVTQSCLCFVGRSPARRSADCDHRPGAAHLHDRTERLLRHQLGNQSHHRS
jgi:hypothetical protein